VEKNEGKGTGMAESTGLSLELMGNNARPSPREGINFIVVQISMLADRKRK
jgi:p-aminobenzoyl-glutamate transporter AbgT